MAQQVHDGDKGDNAATDPTTPRSPHRFRPELHGLRGLAIALVVVYHLFGHGRVSGGIDVFLAISGFLFAGMVLRQIERDGWVNVLAYLGRLARRLVPPALLVLGATGVAGWLILPESRWAQLAAELRAAVLYRENFELIDSQLGYEAAGVLTSPVQHFWSMSVQGQYYLFWLALALVCAVLVRWTPLSARIALAGASALLLAASFAYAIHLHHVHQQVAYLHTATRLWEPAFGALFALGLGARQLPKALAIPAGWVGLALIATCGLALDGAALFPGPWTLWPLAGFSLVLAAGTTTSPWAADRALATAPLRWLGDIAYPLFLWHWPVLVFMVAALDRDALAPWQSLAALALSLLLADLTHRLMEVPLTSLLGARPASALTVGVACVALATAGATTWAADIDHRRQQQLQELAAAQRAADLDVAGADENYPGSIALNDPDFGNTGIDIQPAPPIAMEDDPPHRSWNCVQTHADASYAGEVLTCNITTASDGATIVVAGGSHAEQWAVPLAPLARENGWNLQVVSKSGCQLTRAKGPNPDGRWPWPEASCQEWNDNFLTVMADLKPDAVVTIGTTSLGGIDNLPTGFVDAWRELEALGIPVIGFRDNARLPGRAPECLEEGGDATSCGLPRSDGYLDTPTYLTEPDVPSNVTFIDLVDQWCTETWCPTVIGNVLAYRDNSHMSATYLRTLTPAVDDALRSEAPWLYQGASPKK